MSNLHEATTTGSAISVGPVTVTRAFQKFAGASSVLVLVSDASVQAPIALKLWGPASNTAFTEGMIVTIQAQGPKGKLEYKEYKGKWELNANECQVIVAGDGAAPQHAPQTAPQSAPASSGGYQPPTRPTAHSGGNEGAQSLSYEEMERRMQSYAKNVALFSRILVDELVLNHGFSKEEALTLAGGAGAGLYPQSWFLQKGF